MKKFYITTAIDYPNALPHVGTAFEKIGADVQARYRRFCGQDVYFLMGNDENTWKVASRAHELGKDARIYCNDMAEQFRAVWQKLNISFDYFIQTTDTQHRMGVTDFINVVNEAGYIYKKKYSGLYCDGCEAFKTLKEAVGGICPDHQRKLRLVEEENYFFRLSAFRERLLGHYHDYLLEIKPISRFNEIVNFVQNDLQDVSISRNNLGWGIPIPWDNSQVIYVWFDALLNYLTGAGFGTSQEKFEQCWPADIHFIGKDIVRFHCALWPAMIWAYNERAEHKIALPQTIYAHGFVYQRTEEGLVKIAKTGKRIDPVKLIDTFGADAYRYFFLAKCDYGSDSEFSVKQFIDTYNTDLANNLGNLASRVVSMTNKYCGGKLDHIERWGFSAHVIGDFLQHTQNCKYRDALTIVQRLLQDANFFLEEAKPWKLVKDDLGACARALHRTAHLLRVLALLLKPYLPATAEKLYNTFTGDVPFAQADSVYLTKLVVDGPQATTINPAVLVDGNYPPLFPRFTDESLFMEEV